MKWIAPASDKSSTKQKNRHLFLKTQINKLFSESLLRIRAFSSNMEFFVWHSYSNLNLLWQFSWRNRRLFRCGAVREQIGQHVLCSWVHVVVEEWREGGYLSSAGPLVVTISSPSFIFIPRNNAFHSSLQQDSAIEKLYSHLLSKPLFINVLHSLRVVLY